MALIRPISSAAPQLIGTGGVGTNTFNVAGLSSDTSKYHVVIDSMANGATGTSNEATGSYRISTTAYAELTKTIENDTLTITLTARAEGSYAVSSTSTPTINYSVYLW